MKFKYSLVVGLIVFQSLTMGNVIKTGIKMWLMNVGFFPQIKEQFSGPARFHI